MHEELAKLLGRLRYRTSYGQNILKHSLECSHLAGIMASELGASVKTAKRAALLHDVGKAMTHEVEGSHAVISAQQAKKFGESQHVVHAIEAHHYEVQPQTVEAVLVIAADAISASRPGARGESLENYIKRLETLEKIAGDRKGVERVYALQAGREIRVMVKPTEIDDDAAVLLSHEIAREIEGAARVPGSDQGDGHPREPRGRVRQVAPLQGAGSPISVNLATWGSWSLVWSANSEFTCTTS
jgi:ribonuclease Y